MPCLQPKQSSAEQITVMPEGEKHWGCQYVVIGGDNLPSPVGIGLTDRPNIGEASGPPGPLGSSITEIE